MYTDVGVVGDDQGNFGTRIAAARRKGYSEGSHARPIGHPGVAATAGAKRVPKRGKAKLWVTVSSS